MHVCESDSFTYYFSFTYYDFVIHLRIMILGSLQIYIASPHQISLCPQLLDRCFL